MVLLTPRAVTIRRSLASCLAFLCLLTARDVNAQVAACDKDQSCIGNALVIQKTIGKGAQYVDLDTSYLLRNLDAAMTFEAWIKPSAQPGKRQFIGGLWGPNKDNNDQWVFYIEDNNISFALSADGSFKGDADNTIATASVPDLYTKGWRHVAATFDGPTATIKVYVDGVLLATQIASCNQLNDDTTKYRAFKGMIDEVRMWSNTLTQNEIMCQRFKSLQGNEAGLIFYYRCNEAPSVLTLCDATNHDIRGKLRSGAFCDASDRVFPDFYSVTPQSLSGSMICTTDSTFSFTITDTSACGDHVFLGLNGPNAGLFTLSTNSLILVKGIPQTFTARIIAPILGTLTANLVIWNADRCGNVITIPITIQRSTELNYSTGAIDLDTLYVGCAERKFSEKSIDICNKTARTITITGATLDSLRFTLLHVQLPVVLKPGDCFKVTVHMDVADTTKSYYDTLRIASDEVCPGSGVVPIFGRSQDVLGVLTPNGKKRLDSLFFEAVCPGQISNSQTWQFRSLAPDTVHLESIDISANFFGQGFRFPLALAPKQAYQPTFVRFRPDKPGPFTGTMTIVATFRGCTITKIVYLFGRGIDVNLEFTSGLVQFGNVSIGKTSTQIVTVTNKGADTRTMSAYLKVGDVYRIIAGQTFSIGPNATKNVTIEFRPREQKKYFDTLCLFDQGCYGTFCNAVEGSGVFQSLSFSPPFLSIPPVIGCQCEQDTLTIQNITSSPFSIVSQTLSDPSGKFSMIEQPPNGTLGPNQSGRYILRYCPNDQQADRADEAFIDITLSDGQVYHALVRATSFAPRAYVTPLTTYGTVEAGAFKDDSVLIENASALPLRINSISVGTGFQLLSTNPPVPAILAPRDSLWARVRFMPLAAVDYSSPITVNIDTPCTLVYGGTLTGKGKVVKLEVPITFMNFGLIRPCECRTQLVPLPNNSSLVPLTIDSIWIDGLGVSAQVPSVFSWKSQQTGGTTLPYTIPAGKTDTLLISFCPNIPALTGNFVKTDTLHIEAHGPGWNQTFESLLSGRREFNFTPNKPLIAFPATRVDTSAPPGFVDFSVPNVLQNPSGDSVIITGVTFNPDQRVFTAEAADSSVLPWIIKRGKKFSIRVKFVPRAPKDYVARMEVHTSFPCNSVDTSVLVMGSGFAPAFGLQMAFDTSKIARDTIRLTTCDTLLLPIMTTRPIPQPTIDMKFRVQYDTTELKLLGIESKYTTDLSVSDTGDGARATMKKATGIEPGIFAYIKFAVIGPAGAFPIFLNDFDFDSDELVFFKIIAGLDQGWVIIEQPRISMTQLTQFDTVNIKECLDRTLAVTNPGTIPIRFDSLSNLPMWHQLVASSTPLPATLLPGDTVFLTVRFCPKDEVLFDTMMMATSNVPCTITDSGRVTSFGYAPPFPMKLTLDNNLFIADTIAGIIADTLYVTISSDRDIPQSPIDLNFSLQYNQRALEYLGVASAYTTPTASLSATGVDISLPRSIDVKKGEIAQLKFVAAIPDSIISLMTLSPGTFTSDSIFFVKPQPVGDTSIVRIDGRCNITRLNFRGGTNTFAAPYPNPATSTAELRFQFFEDCTPKVLIYDEMGSLRMTLLGGSELYKGGSYRLKFSTLQLGAGVYHCKLEAGNYNAVQRLVIAH